MKNIKIAQFLTLNVLHKNNRSNAHLGLKHKSLITLHETNYLTQVLEDPPLVVQGRKDTIQKFIFLFTLYSNTF